MMPMNIIHLDIKRELPQFQGLHEGADVTFLLGDPGLPQVVELHLSVDSLLGLSNGILDKQLGVPEFIPINILLG